MNVILLHWQVIINFWARHANRMAIHVKNSEATTDLNSCKNIANWYLNRLQPSTILHCTWIWISNQVTIATDCFYLNWIIRNNDKTMRKTIKKVGLFCFLLFLGISCCFHFFSSQWVWSKQLITLKNSLEKEKYSFLFF